MRLSRASLPTEFGSSCDKATTFYPAATRQRSWGFIERNTDVPSETEHYWKRTLKGNALSKALFSRPVSRRIAAKRLSEFMNRVDQVNADSRFLYRVRKVIL